MINAFRNLIYFSSIATFAACNNPNSEIAKIPTDQNLAQIQTQLKDSLGILDTTITLKNVVSSGNYKGKKLTEKLAEKALYKYFALKGGYTRKNVPDSLLNDDGDEPMIIEYDTIYTMNLNGDKYEDAIITYWWGPYSLNGHCVQPHYAVVTNSNANYEISNEDFLSEDFYIDSTRIVGSQNLIFGKFSNCGGHFDLFRNFKLTLK